MKMPRSARPALVLALTILAAVPVVGVSACEGDGCVPTPEECASGAPLLTEGTDLGWAALCVAADGHIIAYAGGDGLAPCGVIVVADQTVAETATDPNDCPRASDPLPGSDWHEDWIESADGTPLHANIFRPEGMADDERTPVILVVTPYANSGGTGEAGFFYADVAPTGPTFPASEGLFLRGIVPEVFERGYSIVVVSLRGFGGSGGCDDFGGELAQADVAAVVEWAAAQPWSTGRVGMWGQSAEGWTQVMALAEDPTGLAAVIVQEAPIDRYSQSYMNGIPYWTTAAGSAARYGRIGLAPPSARATAPHVEQWAGRGVPTATSCGPRNLAGSLQNDPRDPFWAERDLTARAAESEVPVFLGMGFLDSNVKPGSFLPLWSQLRGPKRAWFGQFEHAPLDSPDNPIISFGQIGRDTFKEEALRWLDTHVAEMPAAETGVDLDPPVTVERNDGIWRAERAWPPVDVTEGHLPLLPGTYLDVPGNAAEGSDPARACPGSIGGATGCPRLRNGDGTWTFTPPFETDKHIAGVVSVQANVRTLVPNATLIALAYDVDPSGRATLLTRGAMLLRRRAGTVRLDLYPQDWLVPAGHRLGLLLTGSDTGWFAPIHTGSIVAVGSGSLSYPVLSDQRSEQLDGVLSAAGRARVPISIDPGTIRSRTAE